MLGYKWVGMDWVIERVIVRPDKISARKVLCVVWDSFVALMACDGSVLGSVGATQGKEH